jgi:hypothetical protein
MAPTGFQDAQSGLRPDAFHAAACFRFHAEGAARQREARAATGAPRRAVVVVVGAGALIVAGLIAPSGSGASRAWALLARTYDDRWDRPIERLVRLGSREDPLP